jgi:hypothetical protein
MYSLSASLFRSLFPRIAQCMARSRAGWEARCAALRRQVRFVQPRIEALEGRIVPDAYVFAVNNIPSTGAWSNGADWTDTNTNTVGTVPGASDTADIPIGASCTITSGASSEGVSVEGSLTVQSTLNIEGNINIGQGGLNINGGSVTVGGPNGTSSGTIDTINLGLVTPISTGASPTLAIGAPGLGMGGLVDVSGTMSDIGGGTLTVGGAGGSSGTLDAYSLTVPATTINASGEVEVKHDGTFTGFTTIAGGVIKADNIDVNNGASVTIGPGGASITSGPLSGNLNAEVNASFTLTGPVTLGTGATLGDGKFYIDAPLTVDEPLTVGNAEFVLQDDGSTTTGSIGGSGSIAWYNHEFDWEGGTISGLTGGGFTIESNADFVTSGSDTKTLATSMTNIGPNAVDIGGTGTLTITGSFTNEAPSVEPMEISLASIGGTGLFTNAGYLNIILINGGPSDVFLFVPLDNTANGVIDDEMGAGTLTLDDTSGTSILDGSIGLNSNGLTISGIYTTDSSLSVDSSGGTTLSGTLTIASGASAEIDALILSGGTLTGAGEATLHGECSWVSGTISGSGILTIWGDGTLSLSGSGTESRDLDNQGHVDWLSGSITFSSGVVVHNDLTGVFDDSVGFASIPTINNDGLLELHAGVMLMVDTFTQSSKGTLQSDLDSATSYGVLSVSGAATLDGTLDGNAESGYQPSSGTSFTVLDFHSSSGQFATVNPQGWSAQYSSSSVDLVAG